MEMLDILKDARYKFKMIDQKSGKEKYKNYQFENWSFDTLKEWNEQMEDKEEKARIKGYIDEFIKHNQKS